MQTAFRKCADSGKQGGGYGQAENVQLRDANFESKGSRSERLRG